MKSTGKTRNEIIQYLMGIGDELKADQTNSFELPDIRPKSFVA